MLSPKQEATFYIAIIILALLVGVCLNSAEAAPVKPKQQIGMASWYGGFHHGRLMANGKRFNMYANTVAHRTLPLGTKVTVTNLRNGKTIEATVTDRGPYAKQRVLDVSRGIATKLDMLKSGVASVEITVLQLPEPKKRKQQLRQPPVEPVTLKNTNDPDNLALLIADINKAELQTLDKRIQPKREEPHVNNDTRFKESRNTFTRMFRWRTIQEITPS